MRRMTAVVAVAGLCVLGSMPVHAGVYTDDLSRCLVDSTSKDDRLALVRWMFSAAAAHPAVADVAKITPAQLDDANKSIAGLLMRLLTETCTEQAKKAFKYDGPTAFPASFQVLGQVAGTELFASPEVATAMTGMEKYVDSAKLEALGK